MKNPNLSELEFSRPLSVDKIPSGGLEDKLEANETERRRLTERFGLLELSKLLAELSIQYVRAEHMVAVQGVMTAEVVQQCVVTLEPLATLIKEEIDVLFALPELIKDGAGAPEIETEGQQELEPIINGVIDLGELVAQHLGVALDPYPRKPGLAYVEAKYGDDAEVVNPFAKLADLGKKPTK